MKYFFIQVFFFFVGYYARENWQNYDQLSWTGSFSVSIWNEYEFFFFFLYYIIEQGTDLK